MSSVPNASTTWSKAAPTWSSSLMSTWMTSADAGGLDGAPRGGRPIGVMEIGDRDVGALLGERDGAGLADP
jgi:hypothetical protein